MTFTVTVTSGAGTPSGTVTIKDGATTLASGMQLSATGSATLTTSALAAGTHSITASYSGTANFSSSATSTPLSQQVQYNVKALSTGSLTIVLQLLDYNNTNVSASKLTVTAESVVPYSQTPPTACGATPVQTIAKAFGFTNSYKGMGPAYSYSVNSHGLTKGQQYDLLVQTDGDPIWHAVPFTA